MDTFSPPIFRARCTRSSTRSGTSARTSTSATTRRTRIRQAEKHRENEGKILKIAPNHVQRDSILCRNPRLRHFAGDHPDVPVARPARGQGRPLRAEGGRRHVTDGGAGIPGKKRKSLEKKKLTDRFQEGEEGVCGGGVATSSLIHPSFGRAGTRFSSSPPHN